MLLRKDWGMVLKINACCTEQLERGRRWVASAVIHLALVALAGAVLCGCQRPTPVDTSTPRVVIIGIDGASMRVIETMFANRRLPNLREIAENGVFGPVKSETRPLSPRVWTTAATGKLPSKHGVHGWEKATEGANSELFYSSDRKGHALWNILSDAGKSVAVVNWLITYPPEKVNGVVVSDHALGAQIRAKEQVAQIFAERQGRTLVAVKGSHNSAMAIYPEEWQQRALAPEHANAVLTTVVNPFLDTLADDPFREVHAKLRAYWEVDQRLTSMTLEILEELRPDLTMVLLQGIDRVSHYLFGCLEPQLMYPPTFRPTVEQRLRCQRALYDFYEFTDQLIGHLVADFDENDLVIVVSDHGFEAIFRDSLTGGHESEWTSYGVLFARGPRVKAHAPVLGTTIADLTPTVLAWLGLPLAGDMDGKPGAFLEPSTAPIPELIATYDTRSIERVGDAKSGGESEIKEQLRSLGYLD